MPRQRRQKYIPPNFTLAQYNALAPDEREILLELLIKTFNLAAVKFGWTLEGDMAVLGGPAPRRQAATPPRLAQAVTPSRELAREVHRNTITAAAFTMPTRAAAIAQRASRDPKPDLCMRFFALNSTGTLKTITEYIRQHVTQAKPVTEGAVKVVLWRLGKTGRVALRNGLYTSL